MNGKNYRRDDQPGAVDFRIQVLIALALLVTVIHLGGRQFTWLFSAPEDMENGVGRYEWLLNSDGTGGLYLVNDDGLDGTGGISAALADDENNKAVARSLPAHVAPFFFLPVSLNRADAELLATLPGIGPKLAEKIIALRHEKGGFQEINELRQVSGISSRKLSSIEPLVFCD